ncbi:hypothetical protein B0H17DRAFT_1158660 [Mycena rosella]|uniref:NAD(P)-binding domain-containing protein n=1 Tax=Mycena rosella TaxID=1033263 RepID=A0AAD7GIN1_MYCRO|nr:hypothetical protein B0H17DRAFT_1158660 [Mycena rosella]
MKIILTGTTGFIGTEVLTQCLRNADITSIVVLSRRPLPNALSADPKIQVILMKDFKIYPDEVVKQLEGADACIWSMGTTDAIPELEIDYPLAFARAFSPTLVGHRRKFRYLHTSGVLAEKDQIKSLLFLQEGRRIKGMAENEMIAFAKDEVHEGGWETYIVRPAMVLHVEGDMLKRIGGYLLGTVKVNELAAVMIDVVRNGNEEQILQNAEIVAKGKYLVNAQ